VHVTRDVIIDLLPAYFADEASADTRALVDEFFKADSEFAGMARQYRTSDATRLTTEAAEHAAREWALFRGAQLRQRYRQSSALSAIAASMGWIAGIASTGGVSPLHPGALLAIGLAIVAVALWLLSRRTLTSEG
jgi:hypothetical protein